MEATALPTPYKERSLEPSFGEGGLDLFGVDRSSVDNTSFGLLRNQFILKGEHVGFYGETSHDFSVAIHACRDLGSTPLSLYGESFGGELSDYINEYKIRCLFCSLHKLEEVTRILANSPSLRIIVITDIDPQDNDLNLLAARKRTALSKLHKKVIFTTLQILMAIGGELAPLKSE